MAWKSLGKFIKDRNEALYSLNYEKIMEFYNKYSIEAPKDPQEFWRQVYKVILRQEKAPDAVKKVAQGWIKKNGDRK